MRTTNMIKRTFQWFADIQTSADNLQVITVKAGGNNVKARLLPFFTAFKYYKLGGVKIRLVPASTLPVDPTGLSLEAGESTVDPRDQFNPGLVRITNGEDFWDSITDLPSSQQITAYQEMMLDPRWYKFQLQSGCQRFAKPKFWSVGQVHQDGFPGSVVNLQANTCQFDNDNNITSLTRGVECDRLLGAYDGNMLADELGTYSSKYGLFQTGMKQPVGWMPTDSLTDYTYFSTSLQHIGIGGLTNVPEVELLKIILPKAYKTIYYYRMFVEETVYFRAPVNINCYEVGGIMDILNGTLDRFVAPQVSPIGIDTPGKYGLHIDMGNENQGGH